MNKYIALHTYKTTPEQTWKLLDEVAHGLAIAMDEGKTPARCLYSWNPSVHGRRDYAFCLWEAEKPEDIITTLGVFTDHFTTDLFQVEEIDWAEVTVAARAAAAKAAVEDMTTQEKIKPTPEELHAGGAGNYQALMLTTLEFLKQHQISILDYAHTIGKRHAEPWAPNLTAYQLAQAMAFNFMSVGAKLEELQGDENEGRIVITDWPNAEHLAVYSGSVEDVDTFTQLVSKIAEYQNCSFEMKRQGERLEIYFRRKK